MLRLITNLFAVLLKMNKDFTLLFFKREGKELLGLHYKNFWVLITIFVLTFTAIGFSNGSLIYLNFKMNDPFINWISIPISQKNADSILAVKQLLSEPKVKDQFNFSSVNGYFKWTLYFQDPQLKGAFSAQGRTVEYNDSLLQKIFQKDNRVQGRAFYSEYEIGLIVTENFLETFHYPKNTSHINMLPTRGQDDNLYLPIPVVAVVKELPDLCQFAATPYFYFLKNLDPDGVFPFSPRHTRQLLFFLPGEARESEKFAEALKTFFKNNQSYQQYSPMVLSPLPDSSSYIKGFEVAVSFDPEPDSIEFIRQLYQTVGSSPGLKGFSFIHQYTYRRDYTRYTLGKFDNLSVNFKSLEKVRDFKHYLYQKHDITIDMATVEAKENYNFVTKLTRFISFILLIFSVVSITVFLSNVLKNHLDRIKMNIGTFKAFGLDDLLLKKIYLSITGLFIATAMLISLLISWLFGALGGVRAGLYLFHVNLEPRQNYFALLHEWTGISILIILVTSLLALNYTMQNIFSRNPGDLIYDRERD